MTELFRRRADGHGLAELARWMQDQGVLTPKGNPGWSLTFTANVIASPVYLGRLARGPYVNDHAHPPLVDPVTWQAAQRPRQLSTFSARRIAPLSGLVRCASCGMRMSAVTRRHERRVTSGYACRIYSAAGRCPAPAYISAPALEQRVVGAMWHLLEHRRGGHEAQVAAAEQRAAAAEDDLTIYRDTPDLLRVLGPQRFADGLQARMDTLRDARLDASALRASAATVELAPAAALRANWSRLTEREQRDTAARVIDCVFVAPGRKNWDRRVVVCPRGTGPRDLPRAGDKRSAMKTYAVRPSWIRPWPGIGQSGNRGTAGSAADSGTFGRSRRTAVLR